MSYFIQPFAYCYRFSHFVALNAHRPIIIKWKTNRQLFITPICCELFSQYTKGAYTTHWNTYCACISTDIHALPPLQAYKFNRQNAKRLSCSSTDASSFGRSISTVVTAKCVREQHIFNCPCTWLFRSWHFQWRWRWRDVMVSVYWLLLALLSFERFRSCEPCVWKTNQWNDMKLIK